MFRMKKLPAIMLAVIMMVSVCSPVNATGISTQKADAVIDAELRDVLATSDKDAQIPVDIWLYDKVHFIGVGVIVIPDGKTILETYEAIRKNPPKVA